MYLKLECMLRLLCLYPCYITDQLTINTCLIGLSYYCYTCPDKSALIFLPDLSNHCTNVKISIFKHFFLFGLYFSTELCLNRKNFYDYSLVSKFSTENTYNRSPSIRKRSKFDAVRFTDRSFSHLFTYTRQRKTSCFIVLTVCNSMLYRPNTSGGPCTRGP